jgi:2-phospho-L-lactate guanylyltransferase
MHDRPWLLLPVKSLECGKRRLGPVLGHAERRLLNEFFLRHTLAVAADFPGLQKTAVVSDAADALSLAAKLGARTIRSNRQGLNRALADGCHELYRSEAKKLLIVPIDLPLVQTGDLLEIAALGDRHPLIICPDKHVAGTNAMFLSKELPVQFRFGDDSYRRHQAEARRCGVAPFLHFNERIAQDIDVPADLAILAGTARDPMATARPFLHLLNPARRPR